MRKTFLIIIATVLTVATVNAQVYHEECKEDLRAFLRQGTNYEKLGLTVADTLTWYENEDWVSEVKGITWIGTEGQIERIYWTDRELEGKLELSSPVLTRLDCSRNSLTELDVSNNIELDWLRCSDNNLSELNVSNNTLLRVFSCNNNNLSELDVSNNILLRTFDCSNNNLSELDVSKNIELTGLSCSYNNLSELNLNNNIKLEDLTYTSNNLSELDLSNNIELKRLRNGLNNLTELDVSKNTKLVFLNCPNNNLTELDLSNNTELQQLFCHHNSLTKLDISNNIKLTGLSTGNNSLTELDISNNTELTSLSCSYNNLSELDLSNNIKLQMLSCQHNSLTELDVSNNPELISLYCHNNNLRFSTLPIVDFNGYFYTPQNAIDGGEKGFTDTVDLSSEYEINGNITNYIWYNITTGFQQTIIQPANENGVFTFTEEHAGKRLRCEMTNAQFPSHSINTPFILVYEVEIKLVNIEETPEINFTVSPNPAQTQLTIHHSKEIGNIGLYDLSGRLLKTYTVSETNTVLDISDLDNGIYFITVDGKTVKFIKEP